MAIKIQKSIIAIQKLAFPFLVYYDIDDIYIHFIIVFSILIYKYIFIKNVILIFSVIE